MENKQEAGSICSMTGFARSEGEVQGHRWVFEIKSVNGRGLDIRMRLPSLFDHLSLQIREKLSNSLARGNVSLNMTWEAMSSGKVYRLNEELVDQIIALTGKLEEKHGIKPSLEDILNVRGVIEYVDPIEEEADHSDLDDLILNSIDELMDGMIHSRSQEGGRMGQILMGLLDDMQTCLDAAKQEADTIPDQIKNKLREQLDELIQSTPGLSDERINQEVAVLANKADTKEELDRLSAHIAAGRDLLAQGGVIGRKLDFLCQEFNRESNTICSKSTSLALTNQGLTLKTLIDQFREQVQNIE